MKRKQADNWEGSQQVFANGGQDVPVAQPQEEARRVNDATRLIPTFHSRLRAEGSFVLLLLFGLVMAWLYPIAPFGPLVDGIALMMAAAVIWQNRSLAGSTVVCTAQMAILIHIAIAVFALPYVRDYYRMQLSPDDTVRYYDEVRTVAAALEAGSPLRAFQLLMVLMPDGIPNSGLPLVYVVSFIISAGSYSGISVLFAWMGAMGAFFFARALNKALTPGQGGWYTVLVQFFPSILFWTSWPLKDSLTFLSLSLLTYGLALFLRWNSRSGLVWALSGELGLVLIRPYFLAFTLGGALFVTIIHMQGLARRKSQCQQAFLSAGFAAQMAMLLVVLLTHGFYLQVGAASPMDLLTPQYWRGYQEIAASGSSALTFDQDGGIDLATQRPATSPVQAQTAPPTEAPSLLSRVWSYLSLRASYVSAVLFRPLPWETHNLFSKLSSFENLVLLLLALGAIWNLRRILAALWREPLLLFCALSGAMFVVGFSFQVVNLGTMARLKVNMLPFLLPFACFALDRIWRVFVQRRWLSFVQH
jgi:hypothetical protein